MEQHQAGSGDRPESSRKANQLQPTPSKGISACWDAFRFSPCVGFAQALSKPHQNREKIMFKSILTLSFLLSLSICQSQLCQAGSVRWQDLQDNSQKPTPSSEAQLPAQVQDIFILRNGQIVTPGPGVICADGGGFCRADEIVASENPNWRPIILTASIIGIGVTIYVLRHRETGPRTAISSIDTILSHRETGPRVLVNQADVPEPGTILLLATGLGSGIAGAWRRRNKLRSTRTN